MKKLNKIYLSSTLSLLSLLGSASQVLAQGAAVPAANPNTQDTFGSINAPAGVELFNIQAGSTGEPGIGILIFISNMVRLLSVIAGLWAFLNIVMAGFQYVTAAGDSSSHQKVRDKITMSVIGLVIIVSAYTITGILGFVIFGRADFILNPTLIGPTP